MDIISTAIVVTISEKRRKPTLAQPGNREWVFVIQGINSAIGMKIARYLAIGLSLQLMKAGLQMRKASNRWNNLKSIPSGHVLVHVVF